MTKQHERKLAEMRIAKINARLKKRFPNNKGFLMDDLAIIIDCGEVPTVCIKVVGGNRHDTAFLGWTEVTLGGYGCQPIKTLDQAITIACQKFEEAYLETCKYDPELKALNT